MIYIYLINTQGKIYIMARPDPPHTVIGFENKKDGLDYFEISYQSSHTKGYEKSMSATLHYVFFNPRLVDVKNLDEIKEMAATPAELYHLRHVSGNMIGILCNEKAQKYYEDGTPPALVSDEQEEQLEEVEKELMING